MTDENKVRHAVASDEEQRVLDANELDLAKKTRNPALGALTGRELSDLVSRLRSRRNRARDLANRQGREARGKAAPSGETAARGNIGTLTKHEYLSAALARAQEERTRRSEMANDESVTNESAELTQRDLAEKAMALKVTRQNDPSEMVEDGAPLHPDHPDANSGKGNLEDTARKIAPSGALDHAGELPSRERSRTRH